MLGTSTPNVEVHCEFGLRAGFEVVHFGDDYLQVVDGREELAHVVHKLLHCRRLFNVQEVLQ